jgi:hypothetical protein
MCCLIGMRKSQSNLALSLWNLFRWSRLYLMIRCTVAALGRSHFKNNVFSSCGRINERKITSLFLTQIAKRYPFTYLISVRPIATSKEQWNIWVRTLGNGRWFYAPDTTLPPAHCCCSVGRGRSDRLSLCSERLWSMALKLFPDSEQLMKGLRLWWWTELNNLHLNQAGRQFLTSHLTIP